MMVVYAGAVNPKILLLHDDYEKYICMIQDQKYRHTPKTYRISPI
jgi:hypothetical protein